MKNRLFLIVRFAVSIFLIGFLLWLMRKDIPTVVATLKSAKPFYVFTGVFIYVSAVIIIAIRLLKMISVQGIRLKPREAIYITLIGHFFNNFLPTSIGGDLVKAYYIGKKSNKRPQAFCAVFMDRLFAITPFALIPAVTLMFYHQLIGYKGLAFCVYILLILCAIFLWLIFHKRSAVHIAKIVKFSNTSQWYQTVKQVYNYLNIYSKHIPVVLLNFLLSIIAQVVAVIAVFIFAKAVGVDYVNLKLFFIVVPIIGILTMLPSLNGLGIREGGYVYLLKGYIPAEKAFAISILVLFTLSIISIAGGVIYTLKKQQFVFNTEEIR